LAQDATDGNRFKVKSDEEWSLYSPGTTECGSRTENGPPIRLDLPSTDDEFERKRLLAERKSIADKYVGTVIKFSGHGDLSDGRVGTDGEYELLLSAYDFNSKHYVLTLRATDTGKWPLGNVDPTFGFRTMTVEGEREIGKLGGKSLTVKSTGTDSTYDNRSKIVIPVKVPADEAEGWKKGGTGSVIILLRFVGLGIHKACKQDCGSLLGVYSCMSLNYGLGQYYRASLLGYEIRVNDKVVAEKVPPAAK
jgi:hypothetical protein